VKVAPPVNGRLGKTHHGEVTRTKLGVSGPASELAFGWVAPQPETRPPFGGPKTRTKAFALRRTSSSTRAGQ